MRISGSIKRTSRLSTKCVLRLPRTAFHSGGAMAAKIQGTYVTFVLRNAVGTFSYRNHVAPA